MNLPQKIITLLELEPGLSDREITNRIKGREQPQQHVNQTCRRLATKGIIVRQKRSDGLIGNYPKASDENSSTKLRPVKKFDVHSKGSEDKIKEALRQYLVSRGWNVSVAWGRSKGVDIEAVKPGQRWLIEVKGIGSRNAMRVNYFLSVLGEILQRMGDPNARYSIALPDNYQYRALWKKLPRLSKTRTGIDIIFVDDDGNIVLDN